MVCQLYVYLKFFLKTLSCSKDAYYVFWILYVHCVPGLSWQEKKTFLLLILLQEVIVYKKF